MNGSKKWWLYCVASLGLTASLGAGAYYLVGFLKGAPELNLVEPGRGEAITENEQALGGLKFVEQDSGTQIPYLMTMTNPDKTKSRKRPIDYLIEKMTTRLNAGPELGMLEGIYFMDVKFVDEVWGVYLGQVNRIYINTASVYQTFVEYGFIVNGSQIVGDFDQAAKFIAEFVFQIIFHEYTHHMAYEYLNSDNQADSIQPEQLTRSSKVKDAVGASPSQWKSEEEDWDKDFMETFIKTLNYEDVTKTSYPAKIFSGKMITPLSNEYSLKDIWDKSNNAASTFSDPYDKIRTDLANGTGYYALGPSTQLQKPEAYENGDSLMYTYSADEAFVRRMQQATMVFPNDNTMNSRGQFPSPLANLWGTYYQTPFTIDTLSYSDGIGTNPFYNDYLFDSKLNQVDQPAQKIYDAFTNSMGYDDNGNGTTSDNISAMWFQNDTVIKNDKNDPKKALVVSSNVNNQNQTQTYPTETSKVRLGGYINDDQMKLFNSSNLIGIGYFDNGNWQKVSDLFTSKFNMKVKSKLEDTKGVDNQAALADNYYFTNNYDLDKNIWANDYIDYTSLVGKQLYFGQVDSNGTLVSTPLTSFRAKASTDVGFWDAWNSKPNSHHQYDFDRYTVFAKQGGQIGTTNDHFVELTSKDWGTP